MTEKQPVAETTESEERLESSKNSNVQKGSRPSDTCREHEEAPKQEKAAASPN